MSKTRPSFRPATDRPTNSNGQIEAVIPFEFEDEWIASLKLIKYVAQSA
jgi:hypothetical protein